MGDRDGSRKRITGITEGGITDRSGGAGRRCEFQFRRFSADAHGADGKRGADSRQRRYAHHILEARPVASLERAQRAAREAGLFTLRLPASRLREVNRIFENTAWGSYRTEFYPTYDYKAIGVAAHDKAQ
jgi:hypothetical protein